MKDITVFINENKEVKHYADGILYNKEKTEIIYCPKGKSEITIPETIRYMISVISQQKSTKHFILLELNFLQNGIIVKWWRLDFPAGTRQEQCLNSSNTAT